MIITQILLGKSQAARLKLWDSYAWHCALWDAFAAAAAPQREFLFDVEDQRTQFRVLMLSLSAPRPQPWGIWQSKIIPGSFLQKTYYRFQLKANPTMRRSMDGRRLGIYQEDKQREWIFRKAQFHGFTIESPSLEIQGPLDEFFLKKKNKGKHTSVLFKGILKVENRDKFLECFAHGIGSAKAFGFGLLMLEPLK